MSFTFPEDSNFRIGAVRQAPNSNDFFIPSVIFSADGITPLCTSSNPAITLSIGNNVLLGNYTLTWAASVGGGTVETASLSLPTTFQTEALYLVSVQNPTTLGTSVTLNFQNAINFGSGNQWSTVTSLDVASGATQSYLIQGWLLGDAAAQISATNDSAASASGGTVSVQVRKV